MKVVFLWELARRKWSVLWWTLGIGGLTGLTILAYKSIDGQASKLDQSFSGLTSSAGSFFGGTDFFSPVGYLSSQVYFIVVPVMVIILVTTLASSLVNRDESDGTIELTLSRAINRTQLLVARALAGATLVGLVFLLTYLITVVAVGFVDIKINGLDLFLTHLLSFAFAASFGVISFALMAGSRATRRIANPIAITLAFGGYILSSLGPMVNWLEVPAKFMPYHYYNTADLLGGKIDPGLLWYLAGVLIVSIIFGVYGYTRRDIG